MRRRDQTVCSVLPAVLDIERVEDGFGMKNASDEANAATARMQERWKIIANNSHHFDLCSPRARRVCGDSLLCDATPRSVDVGQHM